MIIIHHNLVAKQIQCAISVIVEVHKIREEEKNRRYQMKLNRKITTFLIAIIISIGLESVVNGNNDEANRLYFGHYNEESGEVNISCDFGIEQWENNKKVDDALFYVWHFTLSNSMGLGGVENPYVSLTIDKFGTFYEDEDGVMIEQLDINTSNKLLTIENFDLGKGILRFKFKFSEIFNAIEPTIVNIKFIVEEGIMYLTKFKAICSYTTTPTEELVNIEYKIPEYTYFKNISVKLNGFKTIEQRKYDEMLSSFSKDDKAVFEKLMKYLTSASYKSEVENRLKKVFPDYTLEDIDSGKVKLNDTEMAEIPNTMNEIIHEYCVNEGMSKKATTQVSTYLKEGLN
jgi:hypothetical protein